MEVKTKPMSGIFVGSETGKLTKVLIHRPDDGIERVTPSRALDLLYEDIVYLPKMREEHDVFTEALKIFTGDENLIDVQELLIDILRIPEVKRELLETTWKMENLSLDDLKRMGPLEAREAARLLITGIAGTKTLFNPLPNLIFTRDIGVVINNFLLVCLASKNARRRESLIASRIFKYHPLFTEISSNNRILTIGTEQDLFFSKDNSLSVEGGDLMMISDDHLIMATSERTTDAALHNLMATLFERDAVKKITWVNLPKDRYCMHLDTIFTKISSRECVCFAPLIMEDDRMPATVYIKEGKPEKFSSIRSVLLNENPWMDFIACGEGIAPFDEREQWTDGCNLVAVKEGVAFTYDRNVKTNDALKDHGFNIIKACDLTDQVKKGNLHSETIERTIITIPSSELSRARGGPHCMTMPINRI